MDRSPHGIAPRSRLTGWRPTPGAAALMALQGCVWLLLFLVLGAPEWIMKLVLVPDRALGPEPWRLVTSAFVHPDFRSLAFNVVGIWFFGSMVEQQRGRNRMVAVFVVGQIAGAAFASAVGRLLGGGVPAVAYSFGTSALLAGISVLYWSQPVSVFGAAPVRGRSVALILIAIATVPLAWHAQWVELAGTLAALGAGALTVESRVGGKAQHGWQRFRFWRLRRRYRVIPGGRDRRGFVN